MQELLDKDLRFMDGVPIKALPAEHQVAEARHSIKCAPTSSMDTIRDMQVKMWHNVNKN